MFYPLLIFSLENSRLVAVFAEAFPKTLFFDYNWDVFFTMEKNIFDILSDLDIAHTVHDHEPFFTADQADAWMEKNMPDLFRKAGKSKNLFLCNENGNKHFLVILESRKRLDIAGLARFLNEKKLAFASEERLKEFLGLTPGAVSPFGLVNDVRNAVYVIIDSALTKFDTLLYHPNVNTATVEISCDDFFKFLRSAGNKVVITDL